MPTVVRSTPTCSILAIRRGRADSEDDVAKISRYSRARYSHQLEDGDAGDGAEQRSEDTEDEDQAGEVEARSSG